MCHHAQLIFRFLVEMVFHLVEQDGLDLLTSGDPPTLASQSAWITGVSHRAQPGDVLVVTTGAVGRCYWSVVGRDQGCC